MAALVVCVVKPSPPSPLLSTPLSPNSVKIFLLDWQPQNVKEAMEAGMTDRQTDRHTVSVAPP